MTWRSNGVYLLDHCLGTKQLPPLLAAGGVRIRLHKSIAAPNAEDEEWIPKAAKQGLIVVTQDAEMMHNSYELQALIKFGAHYLTFGRAHYTAKTQAEIFLSHIRRLDQIFKVSSPPVFAKLTQSECSLYLEGRWQRALRKHENEKFWR